MTVTAEPRYRNLFPLATWALVGLASGLGAAFTHGFTEAALLAVAIAAAIEVTKDPHVLSWLAFIPQSPYARPFGGALLTVLVFMLGWAFGYPWIREYPRKDGLIANFNGAVDYPTRTYNGGHVDVVVDSDWNRSSKVWYQRVAERESEGALRVHYELNSSDASPSYGGVFIDLSPPPVVTFDVSNFHALRFKLRMGQTIQHGNLDFAVSLASSNITCGWYDYLHFTVAQDDLITDWKEIEAPFQKFKVPGFSTHEHHLDPHMVFRVTFVMRGAAGRVEHGFFEIDDVMFQ